MKRSRFLSLLLIFCFSFVVSVLFFSKYPQSAHAVATHIVISEVQVSGTTADDEFVELYNPTENSVNVSGWKLKKETVLGATTSANLVASISGSISSHGYFLVTSSQSSASGSADMLYSTTNHIAANNTVLLFDNNTSLVDKLGMGNASDKEGTAIGNPTAGKSVERKANSSSTILSMTTGVDEFAGNGEDTDNNSADFILRNASEPQNSHSPIEPPDPTVTPTTTETPSPTNSPTPTMTVTPTLTPTEIPTMTPTETPIPTVTPTETPIPTSTPTETPMPTFTPTPTLSPSPSPTMTPTPTFTPTPTVTPIPTFTPTPTMTETPTPTPTVTLTPTLSITATPTMTQMPTVTITNAPTVTETATPTPSISSAPTATPTTSMHQFPFPPFRFVCTLKPQEITFGRFHISIPFLHCSWEKIK